VGAALRAADLIGIDAPHMVLTRLVFRPEGRSRLLVCDMQ
jgi:hypothetical protein